MRPIRVFSVICCAAGMVLAAVTSASSQEQQAARTAGFDHAATFGTYVDEAGNITYPKNFILNWVHMGSWAIHEEESIPDIHNVYAPIEVIEEFKRTGDFADGAMMIKEVRHARGAEHATGQAYWAEDVIVWFVMIKDDKNRFPDNNLWGHGWGWALFEGADPDKQVATDYETDCFGCHVPAEKTDWTYVYAYPVLGPDVAKFAPPRPEDAAMPSAQDSEMVAGLEHMAPADLELGEKVYKRCKSCHSLKPGKNGTGPSLFGVFGRKAGTAPGFKYSEAMAASEVIWDNDTLDRHLADVPNFIPGNRMGKVFKKGVQKPEQRQAVIDYLQSVGKE